MSTNPLLLLLLLSSLSPISSSLDATSFVFAGCSQPKYTPNSPYNYNIDSLLSSLANAASFTSYANFTSSSATPSAPAFGLFQCQADIPLPTCQSCIHSSLQQLSTLCPYAQAAAIQLHACFLRYGNDSFIARPDTSLLYKKCGSLLNSLQYNSQLFAMRDAAIAAAQAVTGMYRAGAAGYVQAMAQCVGDLTFKDCDNCVSNAAAQLRDNCAFAASGDLYLGKCYVRYWSNGVYNSHSNSGDEAGKTLAIIIGLMAGVALIIVFLSFIRKASDGKY